MLMVAVALIAMTVGSMAEGLGVGVNVGTLGIGVEATLGVSDQLNVRFAGNFASIELSELVETEDNVDAAAEEIDLTLDLQTLGAIADWHVFDGTFRISAGAMLNNNEVTMSAAVGESVEVGDTTYTVSSLDGSVTFGDIAPYVGIGWGNALDDSGNWTFAMDIGVLLQGSPEVELAATASNAALQNALNADLEKEAQTIEDDVEGITMYPVISLGFAYRF